MKVAPLLFFITILLASCDDKVTVNKFVDPTFQRIADFQDKRLGDSVSTFLNDANPAYRHAAALAFASIQDSTYALLLKKVLFEDGGSSVRKAAAFSLGQTPCIASEEILFSASAKEKNNSVLQEIIEAYGKVATKWKLRVTPGDSLLEEAIAWSYYRMAVRGVSDQALNKEAKNLLMSSYQPVRLAAAHFFARGAKDYDHIQQELIEAATHDPSADVRMAAIFSLRKIQTDSARLAASHLLKNDNDARVRINAARALQDFPFAVTNNVLLAALSDVDRNVGIAVSEVIKNSITADYVELIHDIAKQNIPWRIQANLYEAIIKIKGDITIAKEIEMMYSRSRNVYQKAALISALQHFLPAHEFIAAELLNAEALVIKCSAASAIVGMNYHENFSDTLKKTFAVLYRNAVRQGDPAVVGIIASALGDSTLQYRNVIQDFDFLKEARKKLTLPKDFESVVPLEAALNYFENREDDESIKNDFNHPIDWNLVKRIPHDQYALIKTQKGDIKLKLFVEESPGSVSNFVSLALKKYYDGKQFHRVVPNFVVQGGCPRGDGWGSENYSIRSEFSMRRYTVGSIGMASAGKDTEGTQWFITHSATPHLDGRYTVFAQVTRGMDVVDNLEVSDTILSVEIINFKPL